MSNRWKALVDEFRGLEEFAAAADPETEALLLTVETLLETSDPPPLRTP
jgi:hypothetical protein